MKVLLSLGLAILIYAVPNFGYLNKVDYSGVYYAEIKNPNILKEQIDLAGNENFKHIFIYYDGVSSVTYQTRGYYKLKGNKLQLFPTSFEINSGLIQHNENISQVKLRRLRGSEIWQEKAIINKKTPKLFNEFLAAFESGVSQLKSRYYFKQMKD